jgi:iron-sulfur cluster repair protein YtfE (RIC family)
MIHSSIASYSGNSSLVANESTLHRPANQRSVGDDHVPAHPSREISPSELVDHIVRVHHAVVRQSLADLTNRLPTISVLSAARDGQWDKIIQQFSELHDAILVGIRYEESVVFPRLLHWHATCKEQSPPSELLAAAKVVERSHAHGLQMLWRLLRLTRDELTTPFNTRHHRKLTGHPADLLFDQLSAFCDDYERHLFDVECLLLPIVTSGSPSIGNLSAKLLSTHPLPGK